jgi:hypothetical protein
VPKARSQFFVLPSRGGGCQGQRRGPVKADAYDAALTALREDTRHR